MKTLALALAVSISSAGYAFADDMPGADWMKADAVRHELAKVGYSDINELEADDGRWEGEGVKDGKRMEFHADARTGRIISEEPDDD